MESSGKTENFHNIFDVAVLFVDSLYAVLLCEWTSKAVFPTVFWIRVSALPFVMAIYFLIFMDRYKIRKFANSEDCERIKSIKRATYIALVYEDIVGFYLLTFATLIVDVEDQILGKFGWFGLISVLTGRGNSVYCGNIDYEDLQSLQSV